jgi:hypothetical protein
MKREVRDKWCNALESGEYRQGKKQLKTHENEFCCLGVLFDVMGGTWVDGIKAVDKEGFNGIAFLPEGFREAIGLPYDLQGTLSCMNDDDNRSFIYISGWLRDNNNLLTTD